MLFNFYNHPQLLWIWADGTSISCEKSILHVDEGEGVQTNIKRGTSNPDKEAGKNGQKPEPLSSPLGERLLERTRFNYV